MTLTMASDEKVLPVKTRKLVRKNSKVTPKDDSKLEAALESKLESKDNKVTKVDTKLESKDDKIDKVKVIKVKVEKVKVDKVEKVDKVKVVKVKVEKPETNRKVNKKPVLSKVMGINVSPSKVKNVVSNFILNKDAYSALIELKNSRPRVITKIVDKKVVSEQFEGIPLANLSQKTLDYVEFAKREHSASKKLDYAKKYVHSLNESDKKAYVNAKNSAKEEHDKQAHVEYLPTAISTFDIEAFNKTYNPMFYDEFVKNELANPPDNWKSSIDKVTKLKNRFSTNSRVFLSAFIEYVIKQLALNGTVCCVADNKKIIQLSHILDTSKPGFEDRFSLYPLITSLETFKQAKKYIELATLSKVKEKGDKGDKSDKNKEPSEKVEADVFTIDGISAETQHQFRYYVAESCRETRMDLAKTKNPTTDDLMVEYNYTSVSKVFKNFCSTLVCELLLRIGKMLKKEIDIRGIKTVNDNIIGTVISHYHTSCGVDDTNTLDFIKNSTDKYYKYVFDRQETRKLIKNNLSGQNPVDAVVV